MLALIKQQAISNTYLQDFSQYWGRRVPASASNTKRAALERQHVTPRDFSTLPQPGTALRCHTFTSLYMRKKILPLLLLLALPAAAQTINTADAKAKAVAFLNKQRLASGVKRTPVSSKELTLAYQAAADDESYFYVFNREGGRGFIIVGGDLQAREILGYSDEGSFRTDLMPENLKWWLSQYQGQIAQAIRRSRKEGSTSTTAAAAKRLNEAATNATTRTSIPRLLSVSWGQDEPYNLAITGEQNGYKTGCVATAGAQVMTRWKYPTKGNYHTFDAMTLDANNTQARATNTSMTIDWDHMKDSYSYFTYDYSAAENKAVADLMYNLGRASDMEYSTYASGTTARALGAALIRDFYYDAALSVEDRFRYSDEDWEQLVYNELAEGRPVIYSGTAANQGGHCFVCEGYDATNNEYYINWGWRGYCNGYFALTGTNALNDQKTGEEGDGFTDNQSILCGLKPDEGGKYRKALSMEKPVVKELVNNYYDYYFNCTLTDLSLEEYDSTPVYLVFTNKQTGEKTYLLSIYTSSANFKGYYSASIPFHLPSACAPGQTYSVGLAFADENDVMREAYKSASQALPEFTVATPTTSLYLMGNPSFKDNGAFVSTDDFELTLNVKNGTDADITKALYITIYSKAGYSTASCTTEAQLFPAGEVTTIKLKGSDFSGISKLTEGETYTLDVKDDDTYKDIFSKNKFTFQVVPTTQVALNITSAEWATLCLPFSATLPAEVKAYTVSGHEGTDLLLTPVTDGILRINTPYLINGPQGTYNFSGPQSTAGSYSNGMLVGSTSESFTAPKHSYILANYNGSLGFYRIAAEKACRRYSAYLEVPTGLSFTSFRFADGTTTGIQSLPIKDVTDEDATSTVHSEIYDLSGRRPHANAKGLLIINGQKTLKQ